MMKYTPTILVVDDEDDLRKGIKELIESRLGWTVLDARNGYEASEKIEATRSFMSLGTPKIDCVILDVNMPKQGGLDFLKEWREKESFYECLNVVLLTAYDEPYIWQAVCDPVYGRIIEYLIKPFDIDKLIDLLKRIVVLKQGEIIAAQTRVRSYDKRLLHDKSKKPSL
jgi:YesN/AraC family two-component response regulator